MSLETMTKLASTTVGVGGTASINFTNIPQGYTDLVIKVSARTAAAQGACDLSFNSSTSGLTSKIIYAIGSGNAGSVSYGSTIRAGYIVGTDYTASIFCSNEIYISNYSSSNYKSVGIDSVTENNTTEAYSMITAGLWSNPSPINSVTLTVVNNANGVASTFTQHSTFTLYGVKNAAQTAGNSIKATGGNISFDGTYVYHVFNSTGAFTPTQPILADMVVVAGGGGGAHAGGGAGGYLPFITQSLIPTTYACTVGSGGAGSAGTLKSTTGNDSQFGALTLVKGGGGAGVGGTFSPLRNEGLQGGSGGGGAPVGAGVGLGGAGTSGQGNSGGNSGTGAGSYPGGGGGGASAVGGTGVNGTGGGNGGNGLSNPITGGATTSVGQNVSGVYYLAGGGGGGGDFGAGVGGLGGGGAGASATSTAGLANTGGGGGGSSNAGSSAANGGSGIIVIRYKG
jgi:hypothetical protein